jgi:hypothetical protein
VAFNEAPENVIVDILTAPDVDPDWYIPDLFLQGALVVLAGEPAAGKSVLSYYTALAAATGLTMFGGLMRCAEPKRVIYFDEENDGQDRDKYIKRAWFGLCEQNGVDPFGDALMLLTDNFWPVHFHLGSDDWDDTMRDWVQWIKPHAFYIDTATPAFNIVDENNNAEATQAIKRVQAVMRATDPVATAVVLKHAKTRTEKGGRRTIRGAKAWQGMAGSVLFQVAAQGRPRRDSLKLTRLEPDKVRAYGLKSTIYITPRWDDQVTRRALILSGAHKADREHQRLEDADSTDD